MNRFPYCILVLCSWSVRDPLIQSYVLPYLRIIKGLLPEGSSIILQTWEQPAGSREWRATEVLREALFAEGIELVSVPYYGFGLRSIWSQTRFLIRQVRLVKRRSVQTIHAFAPSAAVMGLFIKRITGVRFVVDSWEPHAESMVETGTWASGSAAFRLQWWAEKQLVRESDYLVATSGKMIDYARERLGTIKAKVLYRPACVDLNFFNPERFDRRALRQDLGLDQDAVVGICVSKLGGLYLLAETFKLIQLAEQTFGPSFRMILLSANDPAEIVRLASKWRISPGVIIHRFVTHEEVPKWMAMADFAWNPQKPVPSKRYGTPVKDGEYWAMGLPLLLLPEISDDSGVVSECRAGIVLRSLSTEDMLMALEELRELLNTDHGRMARIRAVAARHRSFDFAIRAYTEIYGSV